MPYFLCKKCSHEFESITKRKCDWCGNEDITVLEEKTPLEKNVAKLRIFFRKAEKKWKYTLMENPPF